MLLQHKKIHNNIVYFCLERFNYGGRTDDTHDFWLVAKFDPKHTTSDVIMGRKTDWKPNQELDINSELKSFISEVKKKLTPKSLYKTR
jgi:hypothetical protein